MLRRNSVQEEPHTWRKRIRESTPAGSCSGGTVPVDEKCSGDLALYDWTEGYLGFFSPMREHVCEKHNGQRVITPTDSPNLLLRKCTSLFADRFDIFIGASLGFRTAGQASDAPETLWMCPGTFQGLKFCISLCRFFDLATSVHG